MLTGNCQSFPRKTHRIPGFRGHFPSVFGILSRKTATKRTVTDSAKNLGITKWAVTRAMDAMEKQDIVERLENRKTVLTMTGKKLAEKYQNQMKVLEQYMQYQDIHTRQCPAGTGSGLFMAATFFPLSSTGNISKTTTTYPWETKGSSIPAS